MSKMIPRVRTWKVRAVEMNKSFLVDTISRRFAMWMAREEHGLWNQTLKVSLYRGGKV